MKNFLFFAVSILIIGACSKSDAPKEIANISFKANISPVSKVAGNSFEAGDAISVFVAEVDDANPNGSLSSSNYAQNLKFSYSNDLFTSTSSLVYPNENSELAFYAVYPYSSQIETPSFVFDVSSDQHSNSDFYKSDLLTACTKASKQNEVALSFDHRLSQVVITLSSIGLPSGTQSAEFSNVLISTNVNLNDNSYKGTGSTTTVNAYPNGTNSFKVILPPQTIKKDEVFFTVNINGVNYSWVPQSSIVLKSGVQYNYTLTIDVSNISFTSQISDWNVEDVIDEIIPKEYQELLGDYIAINKGNTPPDIQGTYFCSPNEMVFDSDGGFEVGHIFADIYYQFYNQDMTLNRLNLRTKQSSSNSVAEGAMIAGEGNAFTALFDEIVTNMETLEDGTDFVITTRMATIISGIKETSGITNLQKAFIILEKSEDPEHAIMDVGEYRVFKDGDAISENTSWPSNVNFVNTNNEDLPIMCRRR